MIGRTENPGALRWRGKHAPIEYTALRILEYLHANEGKAFAVNHLMKLGGLGTQRRDRVRWIVSRFRGLGWVEATVDGRYRITGRGKEVYWGVGRNVLKFFDVFRLGASELSAWSFGKRRLGPEGEERVRYA